MNLANHFSVAVPGMDGPFFDSSVAYICKYNGDDALGLIINKPSPVTVGLIFTVSNRNIPLRFQDESVIMGGPIHINRGYVVHTPIGNQQSSMVATEDVALTSPRGIVENLTDPKKIAKTLVGTSYSSQGRGRLEQELADNVWLTMPADEGVLFDVSYESRYGTAFAKLGVEPASLIYGVEYA